METADDTSPPPEPPPRRRRLGSRRTRVPYVPQVQWSDCGAACLAMVLRYHGHAAPLSEVLEAAGVGRDGLTAAAVLRAGERYGLRGRGVKAELEELKLLPPATILHWDFAHYVVLERLTKAGAHIVDPAQGHRFVPIDALRRQFTGVALVFEPAGDFQRRAGDRGKIAGYLRHLVAERRPLVRTVVMSLLLRLFALGLPVLTGLVVDRVVPHADRHLLLVVGIGLGGVVAFQFLTSLIRAHLLLILRTRLDANMTFGFLDHLVRLPFEFFHQRSAGDLMMRVNSNSTIREILTSNAMSALLDGMFALAYLGIIWVLSATMGVIVLVIALVQGGVFLVSKHRYRDLMAEGLEAQAKAQSYLVELIGGIETLKSAGAERRAVERWSHLFVDELNVSVKRGRLEALVDAFVDAAKIGAPLLILTVGAVEVIDGAMSLGTMLAINALAIGCLSPLAAFVSSALQMQLLGGYIERLDDVFATEPEQDPANAEPAPRLGGDIRLDSVSFSYAGQATAAVRAVSFEVPARSMVAIVGKSGSGKSTLAKLIAGLYRPSVGRILYDDRDVFELDLASLRRQIGVVPQSPWIFGSSIRQNIALTAEQATAREIATAARLAAIEEDILAMPMGYETVVSDAGASLSGGQRQRIALARALLRRPSILLLDEATSALDAATERRVFDNLAGLRCTRIVIAHRLSTIAGADQILVVDEGRLVGRGTHTELKRSCAVYRELVEAQTDVERAQAS